jgi:polysaccharide biosynthesis protein PslH
MGILSKISLVYPLDTMKILMITTRFPYPLIQGDRLRSYHQMELLAQNHEITLVSPIELDCDPKGIEKVRQFCTTLELIPITKQHRRSNTLRVATYDLPRWIPQWFAKDVGDRVQSLLQSQSFDVIYLQMVKAILYLPEGHGIPIVLDFVDAWSLNLARQAQSQTGFRKAFYRLQSHRIERYERKVMGQIAHGIISSKIDQQSIGNFANLSVVPNGVRYPADPIVHEPSDCLSMIFVGNMAYPPNITAISYFVTHVFPLVQSRHSNCELIIIGSNPPETLVQDCTQPGVQFLGFVADLNEYLARATVSVAPMRLGSGIQNKVLEAMASGIPVVATTVGLGGIQASPGLHLLVEDSPDQMADAIVRVFQDSELRQDLIQNSRHLIQEIYTWETAVERIESIYRQVI